MEWESGPRNHSRYHGQITPFFASLFPVNSDSTGSRMLDSIKATLTRVLGPESAQVVEFYVDKHLAIEDPVAFEQALTDFLGSQAGGLLIEQIKSDLRNEHKSGVPEHVSKFLSASAKSSPTKVTRDRLPENPMSMQAPKTGTPQESFVRAAKMATTETGASFKELVTEGLVANKGETCAFATLACVGRKALDDPKAFVEKVATIFSLDGITILEDLTAFFKVKAELRRVTAL